VKPISAFQTAELILIPITFIFSQILIIVFGLSILGADVWFLMGIPMGIGGLIAIFALVIVNLNIEMDEFRQLEVMFRIFSIIGGVVFILIIGVQIIFQTTGILIFSLLSLVISVIGDMMTIQCLYFLHKFVIKQDHSE
jgi:hypothetical protein